MANELPTNDVRNVWQCQTVEVPKMSLDQIRRKAELFRKALGRQNLLAYTLLAFLAGAFGWISFTAPNLLARTGACLFIAGCLFGAWQVHTRGGQRRIPADAAFADCLNFYRSELKLLRDFHKSVWWRLLTLIPGYMILLAGLAKAEPQIRRELIAIGGTFLAFGLLGLWLQLWLGRRVQRQIDVLDGSERQS
jgi:hypothetical protein